MTTGKTIAFSRWISVGKAIYLLFNMLLYRLVIAFFPRRKRLLISWFWWPSAVILLLLCHFSQVRLCVTPVRPHRRQPTRLCRPWDSLGKNTGVGCHFLLQCMKVKSESEVASRVRLFKTPWTAAHPAPLSMGFSRQENWGGVPLPSPELTWECHE